MCGIVFMLPNGGICFRQNIDYLDFKTKVLLQNRGPDAAFIECVDNIIIGGYILWHQGKDLCMQPVDDMNHLFLFNGDIFSFPAEFARKSDTKMLLNLLITAKENLNFCDILNETRGPFSFILYNQMSKDVFFARDRMGRNSLLIEVFNKQFRVLSVTHYDEEKTTRTMELYPLGVYSFNVNEPNKWTLYAWNNLSIQDWSNYIKKLEKFIHGSLDIKQNISVKAIDTPRSASFDFYKLCNQPQFKTVKEKIQNLLCTPEVLKALDAFGELLEQSIKERVSSTVNLCKNCVKKSSRNKCNHSKIAIFFSGGIDCTILALLAHKYVPKTDSIDLINVAFELEDCEEKRFDVPDRITAENAFKELECLTKSRTWNFIKVNVTRDELKLELRKRIKYLIYPLETVLDESIGCAFWFAARGQGMLLDQPHESSARVAILGSGADELFGGYMRYRNAFRQCNGTVDEKNECVTQELEKDWQRIPMRNLGRDDRVIGDSGKTARAPYIEERLVEFVRNLGVEQRCCFDLDEGVGDKLFLRLFGYRLKLYTVFTYRKRAIQFGSRIANKNQKATEKSENLIIFGPNEPFN